ncbi:hypothetical protein ACFLZZ_04780 [Nanoarchaeota archaeon]
MVNEQLINWIKQSYAQGYELSQLHDTLIQQGYSQIEVEEAINTVSAELSPGAVADTGMKPETLETPGWRERFNKTKEVVMPKLKDKRIAIPALVLMAGLFGFMIFSSFGGGDVPIVAAPEIEEPEVQEEVIPEGMVIERVMIIANSIREGEGSKVMSIGSQSLEVEVTGVDRPNYKASFIVNEESFALSYGEEYKLTNGLIFEAVEISVPSNEQAPSLIEYAIYGEEWVEAGGAIRTGQSCSDNVDCHSMINAKQCAESVGSIDGEPLPIIRDLYASNYAPGKFICYAEDLSGKCPTGTAPYCENRECYCPEIKSGAEKVDPNASPKCTNAKSCESWAGTNCESQEASCKFSSELGSLCNCKE